MLNTQYLVDRATASMRPAQKAPENSARMSSRRGIRTRFNEAGAKSAGKLSRTTTLPLARTRFNEAGAKSAGKLHIQHKTYERLIALSPQPQDVDSHWSWAFGSKIWSELIGVRSFRPDFGAN